MDATWMHQAAVQGSGAPVQSPLQYLVYLAATRALEQ